MLMYNTVKERVVEALTYFDPGTRRLAYMQAKEDNSFSFVSKLNEGKHTRIWRQVVVTIALCQD